MNPDNIRLFKDSSAAAEFVNSMSKSGDVILVKGSRGIKMEKIFLKTVFTRFANKIYKKNRPLLISDLSEKFDLSEQESFLLVGAHQHINYKTTPPTAYSPVYMVTINSYLDFFKKGYTSGGLAAHMQGIHEKSIGKKGNGKIFILE